MSLCLAKARMLVHFLSTLLGHGPARMLDHHPDLLRTRWPATTVHPAPYPAGRYSSPLPHKMGRLVPTIIGARVPVALFLWPEPPVSFVWSSCCSRCAFPKLGSFHDFSVGLLSLATIFTPPPFLPYHPVRRWMVTIMTGSNILGDSPSPQTSLLQSAILMLKGSWPSQPKQKTTPWLRLHSTVWMMPGQKHP